MENPAQDSFEPVFNVLEEPDQEPSENPNYFVRTASLYSNTLQSPLYRAKILTV